MEGSRPTDLEKAEPRPPREQELPRVLSFLNEHLRPGSSWSIADEYPHAFSRQNLQNIRIIADGETIVSHAVYRPMILKTPIGVFKAGGIGSVVTSTEHRNQGHSSQIIESCLQAANEAHCDFAILWTNLFDFYRRLGFELAGGEIAVGLNENFAAKTDPADAGFKFVDSTKVAPDAILRVFNQHSVSSHRTLDDIRQSLNIPNSRVSSAWDATGKLVAYAVEGKGADLDGYIHEWGGAVTALLALFRHMRRTQGRDLTLISPAHARNLLTRLQDLGCRRHDGHLGMIKLLKTDSVFSKIKRHARMLGIDDLVLESSVGPNGLRYHFGRGVHVYTSESAADITRLIFGPQKASEMYPFDEKSKEAFERVLPIPLWIWGWDSI